MVPVISKDLLRSQVQNTAAWLWDDSRAADIVRALEGDSYFRMLLAAHHATVATFVPTDVDARIRHHAWTALSSEEEIAHALDTVDEIAAWDVHVVSARVIDSEHGTLSGHDGEWLGVRAGALGRALVVGAAPVVDRVVAVLDAELVREGRIFEEAVRTRAPAERILSIATTIAHNLGDLSRVADQWPGGDKVAAMRARYVRLGHPDGTSPLARASFLLAGSLNKALTALENHRFLPLRKPRALRTSRRLLLPIGPWFDGWGETIARASELDDRDRAEVVAALLELHASSPDQHGCLRALAGIHRATRGGLERYVPDLPARMRKDAMRGRVRDAIDVSEERFRGRVEHKVAELVK
jgi:hypothetical protein